MFRFTIRDMLWLTLSCRSCWAGGLTGGILTRGIRPT
jgi:hypothetical protein